MERNWQADSYHRWWNHCRCDRKSGRPRCTWNLGDTARLQRPGILWRKWGCNRQSNDASDVTLQNTQLSFKNLEFCEGNEAATNSQTMHLTLLCRTHSKASKVWNSVFFVCVFTASESNRQPNTVYNVTLQHPQHSFKSLCKINKAGMNNCTQQCIRHHNHSCLFTWQQHVFFLFKLSLKVSHWHHC